jgi:hypothetical protein
MPSLCPTAVALFRFGWLIILSLACLSPVQGQIRDGGVDPRNLGKGEWIYILANAVNHLGGPVPAVSNLSSLMIYQKNQGVQYLIIKAGDGATKFPTDGNPQLTSDVVNAAHAAGVKIFGYNRSFGTNIPGELSISDYVFNQGADGFVIDAESEWESLNLPNNTVAASNLCTAIRASWPNKFLAHSPYAYISSHSSFPYKEFGYYCDVAMPQDYWVEFGETPTYTALRMNTNWLNWQNSLTGKWTNSIKPLVPVGQGFSSINGTIDASQITEFVTALKTMPNSATAGGYKGVNYFRAELHPLDVFDAVRTNNIGDTPTNAPVLSNVGVSTVSDTSVMISFATDQSSDSVIEFGLTASYGSAVTNSTSIYYHTIAVSGLSPNTTYHYRAKASNAASQTGVSGDFVFTTLAAAVPDIIVDDAGVIYAGSWAVGTATSGLFGSEYRFASTAAGGIATATFRPSINTSGNYDIYIWYIAGSNRATNAPYTISASVATNAVSVDQTGSGSTWRLLASGRNFAAGTNGFVRLSNDVGYSGKVVIADAVKFSYVPPPPSGPSIGTQPQSQVVNQGNTATFNVVASGTGPLSYQWLRNGTNLAGATQSTYQKINAQLADAGTYAVLITNAVNSVLSSNATLTVNVSPSISMQPQSVTTNSGATVSFTVTAAGTAPLAYQWQFEGSDITDATNSMYTRANVQASDNGAYSVVVSNVAGIIESDDAILKINSAAPLRIEAITLLSAGNAKLEMSGGPGTFAIEASAILTNWTELTIVTAAGSLFQYTDPETNLPARFYRLRVAP